MYSSRKPNKRMTFTRFAGWDLRYAALHYGPKCGGLGTMRIALGIAVSMVAVCAWAGDKVRVPLLQPNTSYESVQPPYGLIGMEKGEDRFTAWVVVDRKAIRNQARLNQMILSVYDRLRRRHLDIYFYAAVHNRKSHPAFEVTDLLADYNWRENKVHLLADSHDRGVWVQGPTSVEHLNRDAE